MPGRAVLWARTLVGTGLLLAAGNCASGTAPDAGCRNDAGMLLPTAPPDARVDLGEPRFSNPLGVTNPLFPIGALDRVILLGAVGGVPLRVETTLLPYTQTIEWNGRAVETLVSQYVAFLDRRIHEVALDWYAQADDGAVWYFGEDVFNYEDGAIVDTDGTWRAGRDGPAAMIMPASPRVGDVWRPENICGLVFEEVTARLTDVTVDGPRGPVSGALVVDELHLDGTREDKTFAPGYGEFSTGAGGDLEAVALALPPDALATAPPPGLLILSEGASEIFDRAQVGDWSTVQATAAAMGSEWDSYRAGGVPPRLEEEMSDALASLDAAVAVQAAAASRQAGIDVGLASLDLLARYRSRAETDLALLDLWARQLLVDAAAGDEGAVRSDAATLRWVRDRIAPDVVGGVAQPLNAELRRVEAATRARDLAEAGAAATRLRWALARRREASGH